MGSRPRRTPRLARGLLEAATLACLLSTPLAAAQGIVRERGRPGDFPLVDDGGAADILIGPEDFKVVAIAARDLAADVERVTGRRAAVRNEPIGLSRPVVLIGTLGHAPALDALVAAGRLDVTRMRGQWETSLLATVRDPLPGVRLGLVVAGSDRRGTAYGVYELSQAIGVSPWHWWADVTPERKRRLYVTPEARQLGPPSVRYRGVFLNDEDWGLQPWAAKTFEPETGDIGPRTYAKVFELLLRLKANTLWPAMHKCTRPFHAFAQNPPLADDYAIVIGSSHAEPMLRNNVGEWTAPAEDYDYVRNREGVRRYWEERVATSARFENIYTLGMRGVHDSGMVGPRTDAERKSTLEQVFADQRELLARHVDRSVERVPQVFCAYKEVLGLYRQGLRVPEDVTIVWPDDNFGYIRAFPTAEERARPGGFGVYYHLSYLGAPLSYLWLSTTPPALVFEELTKAYELGARSLWIANVGDLKPAEIATELFLQIAWDARRWRPDTLSEFLPGWARREFGERHAGEIAALLSGYFALNHQRRPEHLQWWLPGQARRDSSLTPAEAASRLASFARLSDDASRLLSMVPATKRDAFYELVVYPVRGSALGNRRFFLGEAAARLPVGGAEARAAAAGAREADRRLREETRYFNEVLAGGKWRHMIALEPADGQWRSMRIAPWAPPEPVSGTGLAASDGAPRRRAPTRVRAPSKWRFGESGGVVAIEAEHFTSKADRSDARFEVVPGLGRTGDAVAVFPPTLASVDLTRIPAAAPRLDYEIEFRSAGTFPLTVSLVPTHPLVPGRGLRLAVAIDDQAPQLLVAERRDGSPEWAQGVLDGATFCSGRVTVRRPGRRTLRVYGVEAGVVLDRLVIDTGGLRPSYLGPAETPR